MIIDPSPCLESCPINSNSIYCRTAPYASSQLEQIPYVPVTVNSFFVLIYICNGNKSIRSALWCIYPRVTHHYHPLPIKLEQNDSYSKGGHIPSPSVHGAIWCLNYKTAPDMTRQQILLKPRRKLFHSTRSSAGHVPVGLINMRPKEDPFVLTLNNWGK